METSRKIAFIVILIALIGVAAYGIMRGSARPDVVSQGETEKDPCAVDISALILDDPQKALKTDEEIVRAMFDHYFSAYTGMTECPAISLKSYRIVSVGDIKQIDETNFTGDIVFDLEPVSIDASEWGSAEATIQDGWILNKRGTLSIRRTSTGYFLMI